MAENNNVENAKIEDIDLDKVAGGITDEEFDAKVEEIAETAKDAYKTLQNIGNTLQEIYKAAETNTCPICKQNIIPGAEKCQPSDYTKHLKIVHYSKK